MDFFKSLFGMGKKSRPLISESEKKIIHQTAHHEAGHAIMGFWVGWSIKSVTIYYNDDGTVKYGSTKYNLGDDEKYALFFQRNNVLQAFDLLEEHEKDQLVKFLHKRILAVFGGPIAEHFYMNGEHANYKYNLNPVDENLLDASSEFLRAVDSNRNAYSLRNDLDKVLHLFQKDKILFRTAKRIAKELIRKDELNENELDAIVDSVGYTVYLEQFLEK